MKTKDEVDYNVATDAATSCGVCSSFVAPAACSIVKGAISDKGTCTDFSPKSGSEAPDEPMPEPSPEAMMENKAGDMAEKMGF